MKIGDICIIKANSSAQIQEFTHKTLLFVKRVHVKDDTLAFILDDITKDKSKFFIGDVPGHIYQVLDSNGRLLFVKRSQLNSVK